jgi:hypothetical protein
MTRNIGGSLDASALSALAGSDARMRAFHVLDREQQAAAIRRLAALGWSEHGISWATKLNVDQIRRVLATETSACT